LDYNLCNEFCEQGHEVNCIIQGLDEYDKDNPVTIHKNLTKTIITFNEMLDGNRLKEVIDKARIEGLNCRFIVGGAVVTRSFARSLGAEYASDSVEAVRVVKKLK